jgi:hypothetical protein
LGEILSRLFPLNKIYQEYGYDLILRRGYDAFDIPEEQRDQNLLKRARRLKADWVVLDLMFIFEYQGEHHYFPISYDGNQDAAESSFHRRAMLDSQKRIIAVEANFYLVEVPYWEQLSEDSILRLIDKAIKRG